MHYIWIIFIFCVMFKFIPHDRFLVLCYAWSLALYAAPNQYNSKHISNFCQMEMFQPFTFTIYKYIDIFSINSVLNVFVCVHICFTAKQNASKLSWHPNAKRLLQGIGIICKIMCCWMNAKYMKDNSRPTHYVNKK